MNVNKRDLGITNADRRETVQRAPRSGGRTAAQWAPAEPAPHNGASESTARGIDPARRAGRRNQVPPGGDRTEDRAGAGGRSPSGRSNPGRANPGRSTSDRQYGTMGSAALSPVEPIRESERSVSAAPRLRVAPPRPVAVPRAPFVAMVLVMVIAGVLGILMINTRTNQNAFRLDKLQQQQAVLDVQQQQLEKQIAEYESPGSLAAQARKLGLVRDEQPAFIRLPDGKVIGVPRPAGGQPAITSQQTGGR